MNACAKSIALAVHSNHFRRDGVTPYVRYLEDVVNNLIKRGVIDQDVIDAAWLHDSIEDRRTTVSYLRSVGIKERVINLVKALTKPEGVDYFTYLFTLKDDDDAIQIKICDMLANLADKPTDKQIRKYAIGLQFLIGDE